MAGAEIMDKGGAEKEPEPQPWFFLYHITTKIYGKKIATKEGIFLYKQLLFCFLNSICILQSYLIV